MAAESGTQSKYLTACLCKLQLPHTEEHANVLPNPLMPTIQLPEEKYSLFDPQREQKKRVEELLADVNAARVEDLQLQRKFEKDAEELLKAYKEGEKCTHSVPQELKDSGAGDSAARLKYELDHSRFQLAEMRNQLHTVRREVAAYEKLVRHELGEHVDLHEVLTSNKWKGRAQEIKHLKTEIANMESKAFDHKYMQNPLCIPTYKHRYPDVNDLIPRNQARVLQKEVQKRREQRERTEREVTALIEQYGNISLMYKASLTHNKMLSEELKSLKDQLEKYETKAKDDQNLIKNLIAHQMQMREMVDREAHLAKLVKKKQKEEIDLEKEDMLDSVKYEALYEATENEKCALEKMVQMLTKRLDDVIEIADEAEKHCADNENRRQEIEREIEAQKEAPAKSKGKGTKAGKPSSQPGFKATLSASTRLKALKEENKYLRDFLLKAIETKVEDLKLYQFTMNSIREQYVDKLRELKSPPEEIDAQQGEGETETTPQK